MATHSLHNTALVTHVHRPVAASNGNYATPLFCHTSAGGCSMATHSLHNTALTATHSLHNTVLVTYVHRPVAASNGNSLATQHCFGNTSIGRWLPQTATHSLHNTALVTHIHRPVAASNGNSLATQHCSGNTRPSAGGCLKRQLTRYTTLF
ncbi:hypothetical protein J6590_040507 [Homalodisca vitripennis]|nr:hypothetical protein J6590_040507 [Homalodisca vitripennis]